MVILECAECACRSDDTGCGWRAYLAGGLDDEGEEELEVVVVCPSCAEREFGQLGAL